MSGDESASVQQAVFEVLENQMRDGTPPETKKTFDRLVSEGHSRGEAMQLLATVLMCEMDQMVRGDEVFSQARFVAALLSLPELPPEDED